MERSFFLTFSMVRSVLRQSQKLTDHSPLFLVPSRAGLARSIGCMAGISDLKGVAKSVQYTVDISEYEDKDTVCPSFDQSLPQVSLSFFILCRKVLKGASLSLASSQGELRAHGKK